MKYKVPFVNYPLQYKILKKEIDEAFRRVLERGDLILRKDVKNFEKRLANFIGTKYAVALNSGTDALFFSLKAAGIGKGDEVITVSHSFIASISAIVHAGARPVLVDIKEDFLIDPEEIEKNITKRTRAIIPVHLNGRVCQMEKIMKIAKKYNLKVIEDAAQALGAKFKGKMAGSFGLTGCFSFYPAKILGAFGDGGAVVTNNKKIAEKISLLRDHCLKRKERIVGFGFNSRLDNLQAAILNVKFKYLKKWIKRRREIATLYERGLKDISHLKLPPGVNSSKFRFDVYQNYVIVAQKRDALKKFLEKKKIETMIKDKIPNHLQRPLKKFNFKLKRTEEISKKILSLPIFPELTNSQINYLINSIRKFYALF